MPPKKNGQKKHTKTKKKPSVNKDVESTVTGFSSLVQDVEGAEGWYPVVYLICKILEIPDLSTRSGLKKIHINFREISRNLDNIYVLHGRHDIIAQAVLAIYTRMCADSILRDRLVNEFDLISKTLNLLERPSCRHVALQALCAITHLGGVEVRAEIAKRTSLLLKALEKYPDDGAAAELSLAVLCHSVTSVMANEMPPDQNLFRQLDLPRLIRITIRELEKPTASALLVSHAIPVLSIISMHGYKEFMAHPSAIDLLSALSLAPDVAIRADAVFGIMRLYAHQHDGSTATFDPRPLLNGPPNYPDNLSDAALGYGFLRTDIVNTVRSIGIFMKAMFKFLKDKDYCALGRAVGPLVPDVEYSVINGTFDVEDPSCGRRMAATDDLGLPFVYWIDALPLAAEALRRQGGVNDAVLADYLDFKHMIVSQKLNEPRNIDKIRRAIERNPRNGYFYYVLSLREGGDKDCLRAVKRGLCCPNLSDFLHTALLYRSVQLASIMGLETSQQASWTRHRSREEGLALLKTAWEDAKTFLDCAAPDNRNIANAADWYIILTIVLYGRGKSDSSELKMPIKKTQARLTRIELLKRLPSASKRWDRVVQRCSQLVNTEAIQSTSKNAEEDLMAWLDSFEDDDNKCHESFRTHPKVNPNDVELYHCSWCRNPSAALRKCSNCEQTRYCDASCQKEHWKTHRDACKRGGKAQTPTTQVEHVQQKVASVGVNDLD